MKLLRRLRLSMTGRGMEIWNIAIARETTIERSALRLWLMAPDFGDLSSKSTEYPNGGYYSCLSRIEYTHSASSRPFRSAHRVQRLAASCCGGGCGCARGRHPSGCPWCRVGARAIPEYARGLRAGQSRVLPYPNAGAA